MMVFVVASAALFGAQAAFAQHPMAQTAPSRSKASSTSGLMSFDAHMNPFLPKDLSYTSRNTVGEHCDVDGNYTDSAKNRCREASSKTTGLTYLVRRSSKDGDRIFILRNGAREPYAQFGQGTDIYRIIYQSPAAEKYALAQGYRLNQQEHIMVATNGSAPPSARTINCKAQLNIGDRLACAKENNSSGTMTTGAPSQAPSPPLAQVPKAQNCASETNLLKRISCEAAAAAGK